jgi:glucan 1,3-beta-glucosidase
MDFPRDQASLVQQFDDPLIASQFLDLHYDHFVTRQDVTNLREAGVTHLRVPLPSSILANSSSPEAWLYFLRLVGWCRQDGIQVWPDLHIIPDGSSSSCQSWNVNQTLRAVQMISNEIMKDGLGDVVRGFGIFNNSPKHGRMEEEEEEEDCNDNDDLQVVRDYASKALHIVRSTLGNDTAIIMGDMNKNATMWNDGWWDDMPNTFLDSHYNQGTVRR